MTVESSGGTIVLDDPDARGFSVSVRFNSDGTHQWSEVDSGVSTQDNGSWSISENTLTMTSSDGERTSFEYVVANNKLTLTLTEAGDKFIMEFTRQ